MDKCPEMERILKKRGTRSTKNILMFNENITTPIRNQKSTFIVNNTCAFDSVVFGIRTSYTNYSFFLNYLDRSNNIFLKFVKDITLHGSDAKHKGRELFY